MASEPIWILDDIVLAIHHRQIAEHGGLDGMRDEGLLQSALGKPKNFYNYTDPKPDIAALAASYAYGITRNHPFVDGNKRTAFVISRLFLKLNGRDISASSAEKYHTFIQLAEGNLSEDELADFIRTHLV